MTLVNIGAADDDGNGDPLRDAYRKLNVITGAYVIDRAVDVGSATATLGNLYIVPASATGAWSAQDGKLAYYNGTSWEFFTAPEGLVLYDQTANEEVRADGADGWTVVTGGGTDYYDIQSGFTTTPITDQVLDTIFVGREVTFPADFSGSGGQIGTNPTGSFVIDVKDDGTDIGTITIGTGGTFTFATVSGTEKVVAAGSILTFVAPTSVDATAANAIWTLLGTAS